MKERFFSIFYSEGRRRKVRGYEKVGQEKSYVVVLPIIWLSIFFIFPLMIILKISLSNAIFAMPPFTDVFNCVGEYTAQICLSLKNYANIISESYYFSAFFNSILIACLTTILCLMFGFAMAYGISCVRDSLKTILLLLVSLSFWTSFLIRIYAWMNLLSYHGIVNSFLIKIGLINSPIHFIGNYYAVCLGMIFCYTPFMIFPIYSVLNKMDKSCLEAAHDLGCHPTKAFWKITIPFSMAGVISGCVLVFSASIGEFVIPELLGSPETLTIARVIWLEFFNNLDWPMACSLSISIMLFIILPVFLFQKKVKIW